MVVLSYCLLAPEETAGHEPVIVCVDPEDTPQDGLAPSATGSSSTTRTMRAAEYSCPK